ncbi:hypothetical protein LTR78_003025 [Recurvomyces mirabilis]|uniref:Oxidoreductase n=1 Tax=Recurvomyces mirabilis TaxID=574656 RepID=A0AAE1C3Q7_9PEZI|nr:hypothetical protein LTR78_003025 [Recurvomyces mirabilis]KAK5157154.1 hypothetical protein LTS14_004672 [Recurvomyces mirabilis]
MAPNSDFSAATDVPSLIGKVILVTGGTAGLGRETVLSFASKQPAHIYFTGRSQPSAEKLVEEVQKKYPEAHITFVPCDLASLKSVQKAARDFLSKVDRLNIVMLNAGVMALPPGLTSDGYEIQFGTNHMGHALLVKLLTPMLEATAESGADVRLVWNTSLGYKGAADYIKNGIVFDKLKTPCKDLSPVLGEWMRYGQSKLANLLYARVYTKHYPSITSVSIHPGVSATGLVTSLSLFQRMFVYATNIGRMVSAEDCASNQQWAATAPLGDGKREVQSGQYYEPVGVKTTPSGEATNDELAEKLWQWTQDELETYTL